MNRRQMNKARAEHIRFEYLIDGVTFHENSNGAISYAKGLVERENKTVKVEEFDTWTKQTSRVFVYSPENIRGDIYNY